MGAWGTGSFDNDDALDWAGAAADGDLERVRLALAPLAAPDGALARAPDAARALAAAEVVATLRGAPPDVLPDAVTTWIATLPLEFDETLLAQARAATDRVVTEPSELLTLWADAGPEDATTWRAGVADLRNRLA